MSNLYKTVERIKDLIINKELIEALSICDESPYKKAPVINSLKINALIKLERYEEALSICEQPKFYDHPVIQSQKIGILVKQNKYEEALEICDRKIFLEEKTIQEQKKNMLMYSSELIEKYTTTKHLKTLVLTKIYCDLIKEEELEIKDLENWENILLKIAYYEKNNKKKGKIFIKSIKQSIINIGDKEKIKTLNILYNRLCNNKLYFNPEIYTNYLNCTINSDLVIDIYNNENKKEEIVVTEKLPTTTPSIKEDTKSKNNELPNKEIVYTGKRVNNRYYQQSSIENNNEQIHTKIFIPIKILFPDEILEIGKNLYIQMQDLNTQKKAIDAWDRFEVLINKDSNDKEALERMINLLERIELNCTSININPDVKRYKKLLNNQENN